MKKKLNETGVMNELRGASAFFPRSDAADDGVTAMMQEAAQERPAVRPAAPSVVEVTVRPVRRKKLRHPFDLYEDQVDRLRDLAHADRKAGGDGSMSRMVREAIDRYLEEQASPKGEE
jgi:hypothetical protein